MASTSFDFDKLKWGSDYNYNSIYKFMASFSIFAN